MEAFAFDFDAALEADIVVEAGRLGLLIDLGEGVFRGPETVVDIAGHVATGYALWEMMGGLVSGARKAKRLTTRGDTDRIGLLAGFVEKREGGQIIVRIGDGDFSTFREKTLPYGSFRLIEIDGVSAVDDAELPHVDVLVDGFAGRAEREAFADTVQEIWLREGVLETVADELSRHESVTEVRSSL